MNIRKRLRISFFLMLVIPVLMVLMTGFLFQRQYEDRENLKAYPPAFLAEIYRLMSADPEKTLTRESLESLIDLAGYENSFIIVEAEGRVAASYPEAPGFMKGHQFPAAGSAIPPRHFYENNSFSTSWTFYFSDGTEGRLTVLTHNNSLMKDLVRRGILSFTLILLILILTNSLLSYFTARSIISPLNILKNAAIRIKDEDLDSPIIYKGKDEFRDVCRAFEEMRIRLKGSLHEQIRYEENRKELLSSISHDLKTPITAIQGYIEGLKDGIADSPEKREKYINTIYSKSRLLNDLIDQLFLYSKLDLKRVQFNFQKIDLSTFIRDIHEELKYDYPQAKITLEANSLPGLRVKADPVHIHRVITNLVDNGIKYRREAAPLISITVTPRERMIEVSISDNGRGIEPEALPYIFDRFYRSDPARSSRTEGSGLGLAISRQIIEAHEGTITAESHPGEGSIIRFSLKAIK